MIHDRARDLTLSPPFRTEPVILTVDPPEKGLHAGTRGAVVEVYKKPRPDYIVEFFDDNGDTIDIFTAYPEQLKPDTKT
jgi:Domain of unknown function (DUF4926)